MDIRGEYRVMINLWFEKWTQGGGIGLALLWSKIKKGKNALSFASPEKEKYFLFIYEVITWGKRKKSSAIYYWQCHGQGRRGRVSLPPPPPQRIYWPPYFWILEVMKVVHASFLVSTIPGTALQGRVWGEGGRGRGGGGGEGRGMNFFAQILPHAFGGWVGGGWG